jgi:hypothetical protein
MGGHGADHQLPIALHEEPLEIGDLRQVDQIGGIRQPLLQGRDQGHAASHQRALR